MRSRALSGLSLVIACDLCLLGTATFAQQAPATSKPSSPPRLGYYTRVRSQVGAASSARGRAARSRFDPTASVASRDGDSSNPLPRQRHSERRRHGGAPLRASTCGQPARTRNPRARGEPQLLSGRPFGAGQQPQCRPPLRPRPARHDAPLRRARIVEPTLRVRRLRHPLRDVHDGAGEEPRLTALRHRLRQRRGRPVACFEQG